MVNPIMHIDGALGFLAVCLCFASFFGFSAAHQCYQEGQDRSGRFGAIVALVLLAAAVASGMGAILTYTPAWAIVPNLTGPLQREHGQ